MNNAEETRTVERRESGSTDSTVEVSSLTIGEYIPHKGVFYKVVDVTENERGVSEARIEAVTVTSGWLKKQKRRMKKEQGKHSERRRRKAWFDDMNARRKAEAAARRAVEAKQREWYAAVAQHEADQVEPALD